MNLGKKLKVALASGLIAASAITVMACGYSQEEYDSHAQSQRAAAENNLRATFIAQPTPTPVKITREVAVPQTVEVTREIPITAEVPVTRVVAVERLVPVTVEVPIAQVIEVTRTVPVTAEVTRELPVTVEITREVPVTRQVEVTREVPVTVEVTNEVKVVREVEVTRIVTATPAPTPTPAPAPTATPRPQPTPTIVPGSRSCIRWDCEFFHDLANNDNPEGRILWASIRLSNDVKLDFRHDINFTIKCPGIGTSSPSRIVDWQVQGHVKWRAIQTVDGGMQPWYADVEENQARLRHTCRVANITPIADP